MQYKTTSTIVGNYTNSKLLTFFSFSNRPDINIQLEYNLVYIKSILDKYDSKHYRLHSIQIYKK